MRAGAWKKGAAPADKCSRRVGVALGGRRAAPGGGSAAQALHRRCLLPRNLRQLAARSACLARETAPAKKKTLLGPDCQNGPLPTALTLRPPGFTAVYVLRAAIGPKIHQRNE